MPDNKGKAPVQNHLNPQRAKDLGIMGFMEPTVTLDGKELARIIEIAFDHGWYHGRDTSPGQLDQFEALGNCKYQISMWLEDKGKV